MKKYTAAAMIGGFLLMSVAEAQQAITRISALENGTLLLDGQRSDLPQIEEKFKQIHDEKGSVWYYRENAKAEPTREAMSVIELVVKYRLPISMSSKADFSDYIDENGNSQPRKP